MTVKSCTMSSALTSLVAVLLASCTALAFQNSYYFSKTAAGRRQSLPRASSCSFQLDNTDVNSTETLKPTLRQKWDKSRRSMIIGMTALASSFVFGDLDEAFALPFGKRGMQSKLFFVNPDKNASASLQQEEIDLNAYTLNSELCLLKLLPVKNPTFRGLERSVIGLSSLKNAQQDVASWNKGEASIVEAIETLDTKRGRLEPVFNPEESTMIQIIKGERGEQLIEAFRTELVELANATSVQNITKTFQVQKKALRSLAEVGEFLVQKFPWNIPTEGQYSYLPRLQGRAKVTFAITRKKRLLGNITIVGE